MNTLGRHILVEFLGCSSQVLNDVPKIESSMIHAAKEAGATVISSNFHHFSPFGVSGVVVIQESHLAIHTWPEYRYAAVDLFTCGNSVEPWISFEILKKAFEAEHGNAIEINRGQLQLLERSEVDLGELRDQTTQKLGDPKLTRSVWFTDRNENIALSIRHKGERLFKEKSPYQKVEIYDTFEYGKMLAVDNMVMCTEKDEHAYHEMITHVPLQLAPHVNNVLVIGGGDGGTVREILRYAHIKNVTMVEIDEAVVRASKEHLPQLAASLEDSRLNLIIEDGIKFAATAGNETYDFIILDSSDPVGPAKGLFSSEFFKNIHRILKPQGFLVAQSESPRFNHAAFVELNQCLKSIFKSVHCFLAFIPTYPTGMWSFTLTSKEQINPVSNLDMSKAETFSEKENLQYYNAEVHKAAFALPTYVKKMLKE
jgi:spermidine synthase